MGNKGILEGYPPMISDSLALFTDIFSSSLIFLMKMLYFNAISYFKTFTSSLQKLSLVFVNISSHFDDISHVKNDCINDIKLE